MIAELFEGKPFALTARLNVLMGGGSIIQQVLLSHIRGQYIIIYT